MLRRLLLAVLLPILASPGASPARAAPLTAPQIMSQFNAVVAQTFTSNSDIEGRLAVGSLIGGATFYNHPRGAASAFGAINAITVTSGVSNANVNNGGNVNVQGSNAGTFNLNGGGKLVNTPAFTIGDFTTPLNALSAQLSGLAANSTVNAADPNNFTFVVTPNAQGMAVFTLTTAQLSLARNLVFSGTADAIIINVTGGSFNSTTNFNANDYLNRHIIWNFASATTLGFMGWHGAVLAPNATVTNSSAMEGFLYAKAFNGRGELHDFPFAGTLTFSAVPAPGGLMVLVMGLAGLGMVQGLRRRRSGWQARRTGAVCA